MRVLGRDPKRGARRTERADQLPANGRVLGYRRERRGRNLIKTRMPTATSSQGENKKCRTKLRTVRATMAMTARAMIQGMVIDVRSGWAVALSGSGSGSGRGGGAQLVRRRLISNSGAPGVCSACVLVSTLPPPVTPVDPDYPRPIPGLHAGRHQGEPRQGSESRRSACARHARESRPGAPGVRPDRRRGVRVRPVGQVQCRRRRHNRSSAAPSCP